MKMSAPLTMASRVRSSKDVLFQKLDRESVLLNLKSGVYFGLDEIGTDIWMMLGESDSLQQITDDIARQYEVSQEQGGKDLLKLIENLLQHELVCVVEN
jgi:hypothetical protein